MFRSMRRKRQQLSREACEKILYEGSAGVLSILGEDGYPYGVPLSYVYVEGKLLFHSAKEGHKIDALRREKKASCIIEKDQVVPEKYTTYFRSVIVFGQIEILCGEEKLAAIEKIAEKYSPEQIEGRVEEIEREFDKFCILEMKINHFTGKEAIELISKTVLEEKRRT